MKEDIKFPPRIIVGTPTVEAYLPNLEDTLTQFKNHAFMDGLDCGLAIADKLSTWLTMNPPIPHETLREYVIEEMNQILKRHEHKTPPMCPPMEAANAKSRPQ